MGNVFPIFKGRENPSRRTDQIFLTSWRRTAGFPASTGREEQGNIISADLPQATDSEEQPQVITPDLNVRNLTRKALVTASMGLHLRASNPCATRNIRPGTVINQCNFALYRNSGPRKRACEPSNVLFPYKGDQKKWVQEYKYWASRNTPLAKFSAWFTFCWDVWKNDSTDHRTSTQNGSISEKKHKHQHTVKYTMNSLIMNNNKKDYLRTCVINPPKPGRPVIIDHISRWLPHITNEPKHFQNWHIAVGKTIKTY